MSSLGIGKIRGLQQISTAGGIFAICAMDHRGSLQSSLERKLGRKMRYQEMVQFKLDMCSVLAPEVSAVLLDPLYGAAQSIARGTLPGNTGLLVSVEATGYQDNPEGRVTTLLDDWGVDKIKKMGASAVKLLVYYRPDMRKVAKKQLEMVRAVAKDCVKHDLPFLVEPVSYPVDSEKGNPADFAMRKPELVIETAHQVTALPIDVLKTEFPVDLHYEKDKAKALEMCHQLNEASTVPWVLLSAGVDYPMFREEVTIACQAGASGFLGGRAIWQEMLQFADRKQRIAYLKTTVVNRLREIVEITTRYAVPWYGKFGLKSNELTAVPENWYRVY